MKAIGSVIRFKCWQYGFAAGNIGKIEKGGSTLPPAGF
jgi:hypothetical protein